MKIITKTILTIVAILFAGGCATTTPTIKSLAGEYQYKIQSIHSADLSRSVHIQLLENGEIRNSDGFRCRQGWVLKDGEVYLPLFGGRTPTIAGQDPIPFPLARLKVESDGSLIGIDVDYKGERVALSDPSLDGGLKLTLKKHKNAGAALLAKPTPISLVGTYEVKNDRGTRTHRIELLENNVAKFFGDYRADGKGESADSAKWKVVGKELHMNISQGEESIDVIFKINSDGSVTCVSIDGEVDQEAEAIGMTFKKIK